MDEKRLGTGVAAKHIPDLNTIKSFHPSREFSITIHRAVMLQLDVGARLCGANGAAIRGKLKLRFSILSTALPQSKTIMKELMLAAGYLR